MSEQRKAVIVVAGVLWQGERCLLARRGEGQRHAGLWEFPGGKLEAGESFEQALVRELEEEFGISCAVGQRVATSRHRYDDFDIELTAFHVESYRGPLELRRHSEVVWVLPDELLSYELSRADVSIAQALSPG